jgi:pyridoxine 4-dehydrogenase
MTASRILDDAVAGTLDLAEALHPYPDDLLIATKAGFRPGKLELGQRSLPPLGRPGHIRAECESSLERLGER